MLTVFSVFLKLNFINGVTENFQQPVTAPAGNGTFITELTVNEIVNGITILTALTVVNTEDDVKNIKTCKNICFYMFRAIFF